MEKAVEGEEREATTKMQKPRRLKGHKGTVTCCIASRDRPGIIATSGEDGRICWFDMRCKDVVLTMDLDNKPISSICFKPGNEDVVYASSGAEVMFFDVHMASSWKQLGSYSYNKEEINQITCSSKSSFIAAADDSGDIKMFLHVTRPVQKECQHVGYYLFLNSIRRFVAVCSFFLGDLGKICSSVQFLPWRPWEVITGGLDAKLMMWDFSKGRQCKIVDFARPDAGSQSNAGQCLNPAFVHALVIPEVDMLDNSGKICVVARGDGVVDVIDIESELAAANSKSSTKSSKGSQSRCGGSKQPTTTAEALDQHIGERFSLDYTLGGHTAAVSCVSFSLFGERGKFIISGGNDSSVKVWDWSKHLDAGESSSSTSNDILRLNIPLSKKVNWLCTTPTDSENIIVCDTSKVVKVYSVT
ncbi:hypothetical protein C5167_013202 [Papaver somniferum]|uniref:Anaphase-promoting complex subunit 4 WD40 domain-containing protein n=1 Tax=Papaver somniferum TaxID=3469 RepID=A0A4Y7J2Q7_PAPSO|nr:hypothetical protein C5167_013202 [Papaver somniferum]